MNVPARGPCHGAKKDLVMASALRERCWLVDDGTAQLAEIDADAPVTARVTPMSVALTRLDTLPPVHEDLDDTLGFLGGMFLAQEREQLRLISGHNKEHSGHLPAFPIQGIVAPEGRT
jgi:hypothetical protein